jgi:small ubiquitin-related modifier
MATPFQAYAEDERSRTPPNDNPNVNATVHPAAEAAAAATAPTAEPTAHADPAAPKLLELCFRDQHGTEVHFKLKPTTKMKKAMDTFAQKTHREARTLRYYFEGLRIIDDHTPGSVSASCVAPSSC